MAMMNKKRTEGGKGMMKVIETELETGHFTFNVIQNAIANTGAIKAWYKESGDTTEAEKFREIFWVLSERALIKTDILAPDYIEIKNYQRKRILQVDRNHSIDEKEDGIKVTLQKVTVVFDTGHVLEMLRPKNRSSAEQFELFSNVLG